MTKKRYLMAYAYEVPHYRTFIVEAETEEEAMKIATQAFDEGRFDEVIAKPEYTEIYDMRVFPFGPLKESQANNHPTLEELLKESYKS